MKKYLDSIFFEHKNANNLRIHNCHVFVFHNETLITAWPVPHKYQAAAIKAAKRRSQQ